MNRSTIVPHDEMVITESVTLAPGTYVLPGGLRVKGDGITIDGQDVTLVGPRGSGVGLQADNVRGLTVRGLSLTGYYHGIRLERCRNVQLEDILVRDTAEIAGINTFLYLWRPLEEAYSGAILLHDVRGGSIRGCDLQHQMNGLLLYGCSELTIEENNASFNSGWGLYMASSSDNLVRNNRFDFCNRVYRRPEDGSIRVEADAAGIVLVYSSSRNRFLHNACLSGGDGIFVAGYDHLGNQGPCSDNLFEDNDCRFSSNNAIESTFSRGNIFRRNNCSRSNYGFWLGYSWENTLEDNVIESNHIVGIAVEHGHDFTIRGNRIRQNEEGVRVWTRGGPVVQHWPGHEVSAHFTLEDNLIEGNRTGFNGYTGPETIDQDCHDFVLRGNTIRDNRDGVRLERVQDCILAGNTFQGNIRSAVTLIGQPGVTLDDNSFINNAAAVLEED